MLHKNRCKPCTACSPEGPNPRAFDNVLHLVRPLPRIRFVEFAYRALSISSIYLLCNTQNSIIHQAPAHPPACREAAFQLRPVAARLFFIQFRAVWWDTPKIRASPLELLLSSAALSSNSFVSWLGRRLSKTPPNPHALHLYFGLPTPLLPFFTIFSEPHFLQHFFSMITKVFRNILITQ